VPQADVPLIESLGRRLQATAAGLTNLGRVRDHNEDTLRLYPTLDLYIVADGMGGHNAGEVASALAVASLENCFRASQHEPLPPELADDARGLDPTAERLAAAVRKANSDVFEISTTHSAHKGMGTTIVALHFSQATEDVHIAHVGDSRCYRIRDARIEQMTRDHSLVSDAIAWKPDITEAELALLPKNMISRAVGRRPTVDVDIRTEKARGGDVFLMCSDGLCGLVDDTAILAIVQSTRDLDGACEALVSSANEAGGTDNVTAVLVRIDEDR
jgi:serine/threonine protein phosphatase PrpC